MLGRTRYPYSRLYPGGNFFNPYVPTPAELEGARTFNPRSDVIAVDLITLQVTPLPAQAAEVHDISFADGRLASASSRDPATSTATVFDLARGHPALLRRGGFRALGSLRYTTATAHFPKQKPRRPVNQPPQKSSIR